MTGLVQLDESGADFSFAAGKSLEKAFAPLLQEDVPEARLREIIAQSSLFLSGKKPISGEIQLSSKASPIQFLLAPTLSFPHGDFAQQTGSFCDQSYSLFAYKTGGKFIAADIKHIPARADYKKIGAGQADTMTKDPEVRLEIFLEKLARGMSDMPDSRDFFSSFTGAVVTRSFDIAMISDPHEALRRNPEVLDEYHRFLRDVLDIQPDTRPAKTPNSIRLTQENYESLAMSMAATHAKIIKPALRNLTELMDVEALKVLDCLPGNQTIGAYQFLSPALDNIKSQQSGKKAYKNKRVSEQSLARLHNLLKTYPLIASVFDLKDRDHQNRLYEIAGNTPFEQEAAMTIFGLHDLGNSEEILENLKGLNESDIGPKAAKNIHTLIYYLQFLEPHQMPAGAEEWNAFQHIAKLDALFANNRLRPDGHTIKELGQGIGRFRSWQDAGAKISREQGQAVVSMARRIGLSVFAPFALNLQAGFALDVERYREEQYQTLVKEWETQGRKAGRPQRQDYPRITQENVIDFCVQKETASYPDYFFRPSSHRDESSLSLVGQMAMRSNLERLAYAGTHFAKYLKGWAEQRDHFAIRDAFIQHAAKYNWLPLPSWNMSLSKRFEGTASRYDVEPLQGPGDLIHALLGSEVSAKDIPIDRYADNNDIHYVSIRDTVSGEPLAICELEQIHGIEKYVQVHPGAIYSLIRDDQHRPVDLSNMQQKALHDYVEHINKKFATGSPHRDYRPKKEYDARRRTIERAAKELAGTIGMIGHDYNDGVQNGATARRLGDLLPEFGLSMDETYKGSPCRHEEYNRLIGFMKACYQVGNISTPDFRNFMQENQDFKPQTRGAGGLQLVQG